MLQNILTGITAYLSTSIDYVIILMLIFGTIGKQSHWAVYWGDLLGTAVLVLVSFCLANLLKLVPATWVLGLLGLIPMFMGVKLWFFGENGSDAAVTKQLQTKSSLSLSVAAITIATCGADNLGIYVPLFAQLSLAGSLTVMLTFLVMLSLFWWLGLFLSRLPLIAILLEKWGGYITALVYVGLGFYILWESGTLMHFLV
ncbi:cadmium resistance transporter [Liquorilactobacillus satsumensis]|uniref:Cadmium binding protein n=1 Tax=Liquorilactobacillus satsumensis DSM 16230 = JCM 12392 TaxID=1423801 RepID=A0A0R1V679_9LACO|nr:cadmium resistance transporter [Liquorilactobacillus satsumensis]KRL98872.1 cadmium binding protein [Liquorilactobacillus satsumensis DSM 16230 = JCM 12392]MCC7666284.1 permease [Liquorilactobacillus satsumensis]MCP9312789.1 cadmium resistance transporter [Liquorilactobacillus satsumensis]MCP9327945.1 cadmium resistance transporter [Liquorilactobacillus satsumensis]MCP9358389.1 cadmium resistance transporter [Liquorilactobacillus satsumensis]